MSLMLMALGLMSACSKSPIEHFEQSNAGKHAQIVGVRLTGDDQLNRMTVMRTLQTLCGSQAMSMIMPEESNTIRMLDQAKGKAAALQRP
ncbi:MAG: hypothetical protein EBW20_12360 [Betaproteobacteria bacterium]|nr:hypothetical protein [Betaproteobacteria bacterium]